MVAFSFAYELIQSKDERNFLSGNIWTKQKKKSMNRSLNQSTKKRKTTWNWIPKPEFFLRKIRKY
jgi:hypothetical protein